MSTISQRTLGRREGMKWAVAWLHGRAGEMNDPGAKAILNTAAFHLGQDAKTTGFVGADSEPPTPAAPASTQPDQK